MNQDTKSADERREERKKAVKEHRENAKKMLEEQREDRAKDTEEAVRRMESTQPTPTQEENDLAKLGVPVDEKEDDGSGETVITRTIVANQPLGSHGYETRQVREHKEKAEERERERERQRQSRQEQQRPPGQ